MVDKELNSDKYIKHHLQNLTFGYCESAGEWRFADGHINIGSKQEAYQEKKEFYNLFLTHNMYNDKSYSTNLMLF